MKFMYDYSMCRILGRFQKLNVYFLDRSTVVTTPPLIGARVPPSRGSKKSTIVPFSVPF